MRVISKGSIMKAGRKHQARISSSGRRCSLVENLETRVLFSTYTVTSLADGNGIISASPRRELQTASTLRPRSTRPNAHVGADMIKFASNLNGHGGA